MAAVNRDAVIDDVEEASGGIAAKTETCLFAHASAATIGQERSAIEKKVIVGKEKDSYRCGAIIRDICQAFVDLTIIVIF